MMLLPFWNGWLLRRHLGVKLHSRQLFAQGPGAFFRCIRIDCPRLASFKKLRSLATATDPTERSDEMRPA